MRASRGEAPPRRPRTAGGRLRADQGGDRGRAVGRAADHSGRSGATTYHYAADASGVYLTETDYPDGSTFKPVSRITLLQTPADPTAGSWNSAGADPLSGIAMTYTGQVTGRKHVNACGQVVD